jgi:hypothetical protein
VRVRWIAALTVIALAGCGGGGPLTHDEFVSQADEICADYNAKFEDALDPMSQGPTHEQINDALEEYARAYEDMAADVTDLEPPANDRAIASYLDRLKRNARGFKEAADKGELMSDETGTAASNSLMKARDLAEKAGLRECSRLNS